MKIEYIGMNIYPQLFFLQSSLQTCYMVYPFSTDLYGLHLLMLTQYVLTIINGHHIYANLIHVIFTSRITNLEKLHND
jgi:hypothetical protein